VQKEVFARKPGRDANPNTSDLRPPTALLKSPILPNPLLDQIPITYDIN